MVEDGSIDVEITSDRLHTVIVELRGVYDDLVKYRWQMQDVLDDGCIGINGLHIADSDMEKYLCTLEFRFKQLKECVDNYPMRDGVRCD